MKSMKEVEMPDQMKRGEIAMFGNVEHFIHHSFAQNAGMSVIFTYGKL